MSCIRRGFRSKVVLEKNFMDDTLATVFEKLIEEQFSEEKLTLLLVKEKLREHGIKLTKRQESQCASHFHKHGLSDFKLRLNRQQEALLKSSGNDSLPLDFSDSNLAAFQERIFSLATDIGTEIAKKNG